MAANILQAADWTAAGSWSLGHVATDNEDAFISHGLKLDVPGSDQGGVELDLLYIPRDFNNAIASSGAPLKIASEEVRHYGGGSLYYCSDMNAGDAHTTDFMLFACANSGVYNEVSCTSGDEGEIGRVVVNRGRVLFTADTDWIAATGAVIVGYIDNQARDAYVELASGIETLPLLVQGGGHVLTYGTVATLVVAAGVCTVEGSAASTSVYVAPGATLNWNSTGTLATLIAAPTANVNLRGNVLAKVITTAYWGPKSVVDYIDELVTITNKYDDRRLTD